MQARIELQLKFRGKIPAADLFQAGWVRTGEAQQTDIYLAGSGSQRIRFSAGHCTYSEREYRPGDICHTRAVVDRDISDAEARRLVNQYSELVRVEKARQSWSKGNIIIYLDDVEHLGEFVEFRGTDREAIVAAAQNFGFDPSASVTQANRDLMLALNFPRWIQWLIRNHDRLSTLVFGATSGVLTTLGILIGVVASGTGLKGVLAAVLCGAFSDSQSDAFAMFQLKMAERGETFSSAMKYALGTIAAKIVVPLLVITPILIGGIRSLAGSVVVGMILLGLVSAEQALVNRKPLAKFVIRNLSLALGISILSFGVGRLIEGVFN